MPADASTIVANIGGVGVVALVLWMIYRQSRQDKTGIDAQTDSTAIALLKEMREERAGDRQFTREELAQVRERVAILEDDKRRHADVLARHAAWDAKSVALLQQSAEPASIAALGDPPPLYPQGG